tara:strand:+ start:442 stop:759 length:318 start_codon:yes stop_codon:yes gene_type:complete
MIKTNFTRTQVLELMEYLDNRKDDEIFDTYQEELDYYVAEKQVNNINYIQCCTELNTSFKKGDKVIACGKLEGKVVSSKTETMVKVEIKGTTIGINARSLELKSI